jgi:hypothetical protein
MVRPDDVNLPCENVNTIKVYSRWFITCEEVALEINAEKN